MEKFLVYAQHIDDTSVRNLTTFQRAACEITSVISNVKVSDSEKYIAVQENSNELSFLIMKGLKLLGSLNMDQALCDEWFKIHSKQKIEIERLAYEHVKYLDVMKNLLRDIHNSFIPRYGFQNVAMACSKFPVHLPNATNSIVSNYQNSLRRRYSFK